MRIVLNCCIIGFLDFILKFQKESSLVLSAQLKFLWALEFIVENDVIMEKCESLTLLIVYNFAMIFVIFQKSNSNCLSNFYIYTFNSQNLFGVYFCKGSLLVLDLSNEYGCWFLVVLLANLRIRSHWYLERNTLKSIINSTATKLKKIIHPLSYNFILFWDFLILYWW